MNQNCNYYVSRTYQAFFFYLASCKNPPPEIDHGQSEIRSTVHSSLVTYTCRDPYILSRNSQVQCLFGNWTGQPPTCEDSK